MKKWLFLTAFLLSSAVTLPSLQSYRSSSGSVLPVYSHISMERGLCVSDQFCSFLVSHAFPVLCQRKGENVMSVTASHPAWEQTVSWATIFIRKSGHLIYPLTGCDSQPLTDGGRDWTDCRRTAYTAHIAQYIQPKHWFPENARPLFRFIILNSFTCV